MLSQLEVIGSYGVPHPFGPVLLLSLYGVGLIGHVALGYGVGEDALLLLRIVETEGRTQVEALEEVQVYIGIAKGAPVSIAVVFVTLKHSHGVIAVGVATHRTSIAAIGGVDGQRGVKLQHVLQETTRSRHLRGAVQGEVLANGELVANEFILGIEASREALEVTGLDDTEVLIIA